MSVEGAAANKDKERRNAGIKRLTRQVYRRRRARYNQAVNRRTLLLSFVSAGAILVAEDKADWKISVEPKGALKAQAPVPVQVSIKDAKGAPVSGATVEMVLTMVEMDHGETKVPAKQVKPGVYEGKPSFMMDGKWNIEVRAKKGSASSTMKQQVSVAE